MKVTLICLFLTLLGGLSDLYSQTPDSCDAPAGITNFYTYDAKQLALREMQGDPIWQDSITIPNQLYKPILNALLAVYNATQYAERDTVVECFGIHSFPNPYPFGVYVNADTSFSWVKKLANNVIPTGNIQIDQLMSTYELTKISQFQFSENITFSFQAAAPLNSVALAKKFEAIDGVVFSESEAIVGDGNNITYTKQNDQISLTYSAGWGDCLAGCISRRYWKFTVINCEVQFAGAFGDHPDIQLECTNTFQCLTEPLCMSWLQDSVKYYQTLYPDCNLPYQYVQVQQYQGAFGENIIGIYVSMGIDAAFWNFYTCDGYLLGSCRITIAGQFCDPPAGLDKYINSPVIWDCQSALPGPVECSTSATNTPKTNDLNARLSPNPGSGQLYLEADFETSTSGTWILADMTGKTHKESIFAATNLRQPIDVSGLPVGMYVLQIRTANAWKAMLWVKQ